MIKGYKAKAAEVKRSPGRPRKKLAEPARERAAKTQAAKAQTEPQQNSQAFPLIIPEQLRTCLMAKEDVESAVRKVFGEVQEKFQAQSGKRKVFLSEAMERLGVKSRSTMWHWHDKGFMRQEHDANGHVFYPEYKIRRAERGEHPEEGGDYEL